MAANTIPNNTIWYVDVVGLIGLRWFAFRVSSNFEAGEYYLCIVLWWKWVCKVVLANLQELYHWTLLCLSLTAQLFYREYLTRYVAYRCAVYLPSDGGL